MKPDEGEVHTDHNGQVWVYMGNTWHPANMSQQWKDRKRLTAVDDEMRYDLGLTILDPALLRRQLAIRYTSPWA